MEWNNVSIVLAVHCGPLTYNHQHIPDFAKSTEFIPLLPHESLQENVFSLAFLLLEVHDLTIQYTVCIIKTSTPFRRNVCLRR